MKRRKKPIHISQSAACGIWGKKGLTETGVKLRRSEARSYVFRITSIRAIGIKTRRERRSQREPEPAKAAKHDERERIAEEEFENPSQTHQEAADEVICADSGDAVTAGAPPAHEFA